MRHCCGPIERRSLFERASRENEELLLLPPLLLLLLMAALLVNTGDKRGNCVSRALPVSLLPPALHLSGKSGPRFFRRDAHNSIKLSLSLSPLIPLYGHFNAAAAVAFAILPSSAGNRRVGGERGRGRRRPARGRRDYVR